MGSVLVLSHDDLVALTNRERPSAQARVLRELGVPFREHPVDGILIVSRVAALAALGDVANHPAGQADEQDAEYEVNVAGVLAHGKKTLAPRP